MLAHLSYSLKGDWLEARQTAVRPCSSWPELIRLLLAKERRGRRLPLESSVSLQTPLRAESVPG